MMGVVIRPIEKPVFGRLWVAQHSACYTGKRPLDPGYLFAAWERA